MINGDRVDALSVIVHRDHIQSRGRVLTEKMKELIPRQMFDVAIRRCWWENCGSSNSESVAQERDGEMLWRRRHAKEKASREAEGREKRMKQVGNVEIPQTAFLAVLQVD